MKTTVEIGDATFRRAKTFAAAKGITLRELLNEALEEKLRRQTSGRKGGEPAWMKLVGEFGKTAAARAETRRIQEVIEGEFEQIEPDDAK